MCACYKVVNVFCLIYFYVHSSLFLPSKLCGFLMLLFRCVLFFSLLHVSLYESIFVCIYVMYVGILCILDRYLCMYVCMYVCLFVCLYVCIYVCMLFCFVPDLEMYMFIVVCDDELFSSNQIE